MKPLLVALALFTSAFSFGADLLKGTSGGVDLKKRLLTVVVDGVKKQVQITDQTKFEMGDGSQPEDPITLDEPYWSLEKLKLTVNTETRDGVEYATLVHLGMTIRAATPAPHPKNEGPSASSMLGTTIPVFSLPTIDGKNLTNKGLLGKVVILDFWATWCVPCRKVSPFMESLHKKYASKGLVVVGANCFESADQQTSKTAADYAKSHGYSYRFAFRCDDLAKKCYVDAIPAILLIDQKGVIRKVQVGWESGSEKALEDQVISLLKK